MSEHTPGPWEQFPGLRIGNQETTTAYAHGESMPESKANARLIAAAPELFEYAKAQDAYDNGRVPPWHACGWCRSCVAKLRELRRSAIAKATE